MPKKKIISCWCLVIAMIFGCAQRGWADELSELKEQMQMMQEQLELQSRQMAEQARQIEAQKQQMDVMQQTVTGLQPKRTTGVSVPSGDIEDRVVALEEQLSEPWPSRLLSLKGAKINIGGELELEFVDTQSDNATADSNPRFQLDKFVLKADAAMTDDVSLYGEIEFAKSSVKMKQAYAKFSHLPFDTSLKAGLTVPYIDVDRKTETHTVNATAFGFRDADIGLFAGGSLPGPFYWKGSVTNGFLLTTKGVGEDSAYAIIHESDDTNDNNKNKEVGFGLGIDQELEDMGKINVMGFGAWGKISDEDKSFLQGITGYGASENDDDKSKGGINLAYALGKFTLIGQYIHAVDGDLQRDGWFLQPSYKLGGPDWKYLNAYEFVFRYNSLDLSLDDVFSDPTTWDRRTYTLAVITDIVKNVKLKTEYNINDEDTGSGDVNNDEFLMQLEYKF